MKFWFQNLQFLEMTKKAIIVQNAQKGFINKSDEKKCERKLSTF